MECHSLNKEAGELDLCLRSPFSERILLDKGRFFAGVSEREFCVSPSWDLDLMKD